MAPTIPRPHWFTPSARQVALRYAGPLALIWATGCPHPDPVQFPAGELGSRPFFMEEGATPTPGGTARIAAYGLLTDTLGRCTSDLGELTSGTCFPAGKKPQPINTDYTKVKFGPSRIYSRTLSVDVNAEVSASVASAKTTVSAQRMQFMLESAAFQQQNLSLSDPIPYVTAVDVGFAVRLVFDVVLTGSDTTASGNFGFGSISTALATRSANVTVRFDSIGVSANVLPESSAANINSVDSYLAVLDGFYRTVAELRSLHTSCVLSPRNKVLERKCKAAFSPSVVAYHVANFALFTRTNQHSLDLIAYSAGYLVGTSTLANGKACQTTLDVLSPKVDAAKLNDFELGFKAAFAEFAPGDRCNSTAPDTQVQHAAKAAQGVAK